MTKKGADENTGKNPLLKDESTQRSFRWPIGKTEPRPQLARRPGLRVLIRAEEGQFSGRPPPKTKEIRNQNIKARKKNPSADKGPWEKKHCIPQQTHDIQQLKNPK